MGSPAGRHSVHSGTEESSIASDHSNAETISNNGEEACPKRKTRPPKTQQVDYPPKELRDLPSDEELPTDEALCNQVRQKVWSLDTRFNAWHCKGSAEGSAKWAM